LICVDEGLRSTSKNPGAAQNWQTYNGTQALSKCMAEKAKDGGAQVFLNTPVATMHHSTDGVVVETKGGQKISAERVIIAMGSKDRSTIAHNPPLDSEYTAWSSGWPQFISGKFHIVYPEATWRTKTTWCNISLGVCCPTSTQLGAFMDVSEPSGKPGIIMVLSKPEAVNRQTMEDIARFAFDVKEPSIEYHEKVWGHAADNTTVHTPYTHTCVGAPPPGQLSKYGKGWRNAIGRVHWAGSDTADEWMFYINGAIQSGQRAASEVKAALG